MEKKILKMYEAPAVEIVEMEAQGVICGSGGSVNQDTEWNDWD